jgi:hypothetical protein
VLLRLRRWARPALPRIALGGLTSLGASLLALAVPQVLRVIVNGPLLSEGSRRGVILGEPIRIIEIAPGAVATEEFSMVRFDGDSERAAAVYAGYEPLVADDIADSIAWTLTRPAHVNIDLVVVRPRAQASNNRIVRAGA